MAEPNIVSKLIKDFPSIGFEAGNSYHWSPKNSIVYYRADHSEDVQAWAILHEVGHALLGHKSFGSDFDLVKMEVLAWEKAKSLASKYSINIEENHIQDCLDTYRDWLDKRSLCPVCNTKSFQTAKSPNYRCFNCHAVWKVTPSRFCRTYRSKQTTSELIYSGF